MFIKLINKIYNICKGKYSIEEVRFVLNNVLMVLCHTITFFIIVCLMNFFWGGLIFYITYILLRSFAGGIHMRTPLKCYVMSILLFIIVIKLCELISINIFLLLAIISVIILSIIAPVDNESKRLNLKETKVYKRIIHIILILYIMIISLLYIFDLNVYVKAICSGIILETFMVIIGKLKNITSIKF